MQRQWFGVATLHTKLESCSPPLPEPLSPERGSGALGRSTIRPFTAVCWDQPRRKAGRAQPKETGIAVPFAFYSFYFKSGVERWEAGCKGWGWSRELAGTQRVRRQSLSFGSKTNPGRERTSLLGLDVSCPLAPNCPFRTLIPSKY